MTIEYATAWLLPLFAGCGIWWLLHAPQRRSGDVLASLGGGWIVGILLAALAAGVLAREYPVNAVGRVGPWLAGVGVLAWLGAGLRLWRSRPCVPDPVPVRAGLGWRALGWLLLALVLLRLAVLVDEAALRPLFAWDAWSAWAVRPKSWILLGHADDYVPMVDWLASAPAPERTMLAWNYPELLAWIEVWFASGAGGWNEPLVNLAWAGALAAFAAALYGQARAFGLAPWMAMALVYALVSLPLIDAHVALAGYADLWVGVVLGLALLAWARWLVFRGPGQWLLAVLLAACLPAIKLDGAIWLLCFGLLVLLERLPPRWRWGTLGVAALLVLAGLALGGFTLPVPGVGGIRIAWGRIDIPGVATYVMQWHPVGAAMLASLFTLPNWHLLWYLLPVVVLLRLDALRRSAAARLLGLFVLLQVAALFVLFFMTSAAAWAEDFTSVNRLILQVVPGVFVFLAVLLRGAATEAGRVAPAPHLPHDAGSAF
ncbi:MAG: hypothetical protein J0H15_10700 [Xanthomonadales bacterium]|nr:hypothetical protein [Xanthomonadales bacterium]